MLLFNFFLHWVVAISFCIGLLPPPAPLAWRPRDLKSWNLEGSLVTFHVLFDSLMSAVSLMGSSFTEATSLFLMNDLVTLFSFFRHT